MNVRVLVIHRVRRESEVEWEIVVTLEKRYAPHLFSLSNYPHAITICFCECGFSDIAEECIFWCYSGPSRRAWSSRTYGANWKKGMSLYGHIIVSLNLNSP